MDNLPDHFEAFEPPIELIRLGEEDSVLAETISRYSVWSAVDWYGQAYGGRLMSHDFGKAKEWIQKNQKALASSVLHARTPEQRTNAIHHICLLTVDHIDPPLAKAIDAIIAAVGQVTTEGRPRKQTRMLEQLQNSLSERTSAFITETFPNIRPTGAGPLRGTLAEAAIRDPAYAQILMEESLSIGQQAERSGFTQRFGSRSSLPPRR
ncbi:MAG TPA: hypothetical protein VFT64_03690 [Rickettsiales bacterium]|nr:hypothetical protein [Rickettsiales bacterium]